MSKQRNQTQRSKQTEEENVSANALEPALDLTELESTL